MDKYFNSLSVKFCLTETDVDLTFARVAVTAKPGEKNKIECDRKNALKAYNALLHFHPQLVSEEETQNLKLEIN